MNYNNFKDIKISHLGLGTMRLPLLNDIVDQKHVNMMIDRAIESGINYFDTAIVYHEGQSEVVLGNALSRHDRSKYYIADKMSFWNIKSNDDLDRVFNESLRKLKVDYIDFYLMHCLNDLTYGIAKKVDAFKWAIKLKEKGLIKYLGFSIHDDDILLLDVLKQANFDFAQIQYNYMDLDDKPGKKGYDILKEHKIPIVIMEPLKGGMLVDLPDNIVQPFIDIKQSNQQMAFRWLYQDNIFCILSGMSNIEQLNDNINIFNCFLPLNDIELSTIEQVKNNINKYKKVDCTGCKYCLPCPKNINIPNEFRAYNQISMNQSSQWISGALINKSSLKDCIECNLCVTKCPQSIQIPTVFKEMLNL